MTKQIYNIALRLFLFSLVMVGCAKQERLNNEYVMQIKNVGLREGVFVRRYQLTQDYGKHQEFTPEILKNFINEVLLPQYLFIQDAYTLGKHRETDIHQKIHAFKVNAIASNHPIKYAELIITKEELYDFYQKQTMKYDVDLVLASSSVMADEVYDFLLKGGKLEAPKQGQEFMFPKLLQYKDILYGQKMLHPAVYEKMETMKPGEISKPVYNMGMWIIILLNKKSKNSERKAFDSKNKELITDAQGIFKYKQQRQLINELKKKYQIKIHTEYYQSMISAYMFEDNYTWIEKAKLEKSDLEQAFIQINENKITLSNFVRNFNLATQHITSPRITENDLAHFVDEYITKYLLYIDILERGVKLDPLVKDKIENKEHRLLYNKYLKEEIAKKVVISDSDARQHYDKTRDKWKANFEKVIKSVKQDLRKKKMYEKKDELVKKLKKKYKVRYNEPMLEDIAEQLTNEKKQTTKEVRTLETN